MRFRHKRSRMDNIRSDVELVMEVLTSDLFIMIDLFWYSVIFTILLFPVFPSFVFAILFFIGTYIFFNSLYFLFFKKRAKEIE